jgi:hypothetical protein
VNTRGVPKPVAVLFKEPKERYPVEVYKCFLIKSTGVTPCTALKTSMKADLLLKPRKTWCCYHLGLGAFERCGGMYFS